MKSTRQKFSLVTTVFGGLAALALRSALADAPPGHFLPGSDIIEDSGTKLHWQRVVPKDAYTASDGASYCAELDLSGDGWRLPTLKELHTLIDDSQIDPAVDGEAFPDTPSEYFWTSSEVPTFPMYRWVVSFEDGTDTWLPVEQEHRVRCVR